MSSETHHYWMVSFSGPAQGHFRLRTKTRHINREDIKVMNASATKFAGRKVPLTGVSYLGEMTDEEWAAESTAEATGEQPGPSA